MEPKSNSAVSRHGAVLFGRRRGPKLRPARRRLLDDVLPRLRADLPNDALSSRPLDLYPPHAQDDLWLEVGFGGGEHLLAVAEANPHIAFLGCEPFVNGVARLLSGLVGAGLADPAAGNVRIYPDDARDLIAALPEASVGRAFILFPDPWPKSRHHKRRLVNKDVLDGLARTMKNGAELRIATDHRAYCRWILARILTHTEFAWTNGHRRSWASRPPDWPGTRYEQKAAAAGRDSVYLIFRRRARTKRGDIAGSP